MTRQHRRDLSDEELRAVARLVVRTYVEVERGQRDPRALRRFLAPQLQFDVEGRTRRPGAVPVGSRDVGGAQFNRIGAGRGYAVVTVRDEDGRWRAVTLVLRRTSTGTWHVVDLRRIHESGVEPSCNSDMGEDGLPSNQIGGAP